MNIRKVSQVMSPLSFCCPKQKYHSYLEFHNKFKLPQYQSLVLPQCVSGIPAYNPLPDPPDNLYVHEYF